MSNPDHKESEEEKRIYEDIKSGIVDVEPEELVEVDVFDEVKEDSQSEE